MENHTPLNLINYYVGKWKELFLPLLLASLLICSSVIYLGKIVPVLFFALLFACCMAGRRASAAVALLLLYLPNAALHIPNVVILSYVIIFLCNIKYINSTCFSRHKTLIGITIAFVVLRFLSIPICNDLELFFFYFRYSILGLFQVILLCILIQDKEDVFFLLSWWCIIGVLCLCCGFIHFSLHGDTYLSSIVEQKNSALVDKGSIDIAIGWVRWIWATAEPNYMGLSLIIPFSIACCFFFLKFNVSNMLFWVLCFLSIFGTFSRSSLLTALLVLLMYILLSKNRFKLLWLSFIFGSVVSIFLLFPEFLSRFQSIGDNISTDGGSGRFSLWREGLNIFASNIVLGVGTGQEVLYSASKNVCHNSIIQIISENGIIGLAVVFVFIRYVFRVARSLKQKTNLFQVTLVGVLINMMTVSQYDFRILLSFVTIMITATSQDRTPQETNDFSIKMRANNVSQLTNKS